MTVATSGIQGAEHSGCTNEELHDEELRENERIKRSALIKNVKIMDATERRSKEVEKERRGGEREARVG